MTRPLVALLAALVVVPASAACLIRPELDGGPDLPRAWEQHRAVAVLARRGAPVYCGGGRSNAVALTFDDGPSPLTSRLLAELRAGGARATFFVVGNRLGLWPRAARAEARLGVVGNHTWSHAHLIRLPRPLVWLELALTQWGAAQELGWKPALFRAPYEEHDRATDAVVHSLGLLQVFWSVDSGDDAPRARPARIVRQVVAGLRPGAIVLMHDLHPWTLRALPQILRAIERRGLRAVSVPELLALDPPAPHQHCPLVLGT